MVLLEHFEALLEDTCGFNGSNVISYRKLILKAAV
jgi:hypothetical protein